MASYYTETPQPIDRLKSLIYQLIYTPLPKKYKGSILDVGCGNGLYLYHLKKNGWSVSGIDMSSKAVKFAQNKFKLKNIKRGFLEKTDYPPNNFKVVTMHHVIEHLYDPGKVLNKIRKSLKKDGILVVSTPNIDSINFYLFRKYWFPLETPRHLYLFNYSSMKKLALNTNFRIDKVFHDRSSHALIRSIKYKYGISVPSLFKIFFIPIMIFFALFGRSDIITFILKRHND